MALSTTAIRSRFMNGFRPGTGEFVMAIILLTLGFYLIVPIILVLSHSFNVAQEIFISREWGLDNWREAFSHPRLFVALGNSFLIWGATATISFPVAIAISWALARVKMPFSYPLEYLFWVAYMTPGTAIAWILLLDPGGGFINVALRYLPFMDLFLDERGLGPFNIFSVPGIVWVQLMGNGIALKVMLLTPAFRNMDMALEDAARVHGSSNIRTMLRVTVPIMISPIVLVLALQLLRIFQSFETEYLLGRPINFYVYSTLIYEKAIKSDPPEYGEATVLASLTLLVIMLIVPMQRWIVSRRQYTTISSSFKPGLIDLGKKWGWVIFGGIAALHLLLTLIQVLALLVGSFMSRSGFFSANPPFTLKHWQYVLDQGVFVNALTTTFTLAITAAIVSPILFSLLAYIIVRTHWRGRGVLDSIVWVSATIPGMLSGLGLLMLFLGTPGLRVIYGTIFALLLVVIVQGNTLGVNISKGAILQIGNDMEDAARVAGVGWLGAYWRIWLPLLAPTLILLRTLNFVAASSATSSVSLLASRETQTLSILALEWATPEWGKREAASICLLFITAMTLGVAMLARRFGLDLGVRHR